MELEEGGVTPPFRPRTAWSSGENTADQEGIMSGPDLHPSPALSSSSEQGLTQHLYRPDQLNYSSKSNLEGGQSPGLGGGIHTSSSPQMFRQRSSSSSTPTAPVPTPRAIKVKQLEEDISKLHKQVESLRQHNSELERELQSASSLTASTDVDVTSLQVKVAQLENQNKKLKEANSRNVDRMTEEISRLQLSGLSSDQTVNHLRQQLSMNEQQVREKDQEIIKLQQEKYQLEQSLASVRVENERLDGERKILERERDRLKEEVQNSPIAEQAPQLGRSNSVRDQGVLRRLNNTLRDKKQLEEVM